MHKKFVTNVDSSQTENRHFEKLLRVIIDNKLSLKEHVKTLFGKARSKLSALSRVAPFMKLNKRKLPFNTLFKVQFIY